MTNKKTTARAQALAQKTTEEMKATQEQIEEMAKALYDRLQNEQGYSYSTDITELFGKQTLFLVLAKVEELAQAEQKTTDIGCYITLKTIEQ